MCKALSYIYVERAGVFERQPIACRQCEECRRSKITDFVHRCCAEAAYSDRVCSITLTYAPRDDGAERVINPQHAQAFFRALRKRGYNVRYFVAAEYGELKGRVHFHAIIFFRGKIHPMPEGMSHIDEWPHGHVNCQWDVDMRAFRYAVKYVAKTVAQIEAEKSDGPAPAAEQWYSMSKKPPLGYEFFQDKAAQALEMGTFPSSFRYRAPGVPGKFYSTIRGATRRDYLNAISQDPETYRRCNEYVQASVAKYALSRAKADAMYQDWLHFFDGFRAELDKGRQPRKLLIKQFVETYCRVDLTKEGYARPMVSRKEFEKWRDNLDRAIAQMKGGNDD